MTDPKQELFDILDEHGNPTGKTKARADVHRDGDWHRNIWVCIINSNHQVLIQKRSPNKDTRPNQWDLSVAGHVSAGQSYLEAAHREIKEELSLDVDPSELELLFKYKDEDEEDRHNYTDNEFSYVYLLQKDVDINKLKIQTEEVSEIKMISYEDLKSKIKSEDPAFAIRTLLYSHLFPVLDSKLFTSP